MNTNEHRELFQFFAGYFHEDWPVDAGTPDDVISSFIAEHRGTRSPLRIAELIEALVAETPDEREIERLLFDEFGCYYVPASDGQSARGWLSHVSQLLRAST